MNIRSCLIVCLLLVIVSCGMAQKGDVIRRAFFDIGSGSTKLVLADVNAKANVVTILHEESDAVAYKLDLDKSRDNRFSQEIQNQGLMVLARMKSAALQKGAVQFAGVATAAFRSATNGAEFAEFIGKTLGIKVTIISQKEEATLGFLAATYDESAKPEDIVVWDIGGGSMQIVSQDATGNYEIYYGKVASVSLANYIIEKIKGQDLTKISSPNPISESDSQNALKYVNEEANRLPQGLREKLQNPATLILGIGGVHYYSIRYQVKAGKEYTLDMVNKTLAQQIGKTDQQIGGQYSSTEVSNLILVKGFMETLGINKIKVKKTNIAHGMLMFPTLWK